MPNRFAGFVSAILLFQAVAPAFACQEEQAPPQQPPAQMTAEEKQEARHRQELADDVKQGKEYAAEVEKELKMTKRPELLERLNRVAAPIIEIARQRIVRVSWGDKRLNTFDYSLKVVEGKDVNAFSLPGGFIYFYEGLIDNAESDDELAGVVAHEIAHASLRHIATLERESSKLSLITLPAILIGILVGNPGLISASQLLTQAKGSGWSVKAEKAADLAGFDYMTAAGYNPVALLTFMERLAFRDRLQNMGDWGIYTTHPPSQERAEAMRDLLMEAKVPIRRSEVSSSLSVQRKMLEDKSVEISFAGKKIYRFFGSDAEERAKVAAEQINHFFDQVPRMSEIIPDGMDAIEGRGETLLQVTAEDKELSGKDISVLRREALAAMKAANYELTYRVWSFFVR